MDSWDVSGMEYQISERNRRVDRLLRYIRRLEVDRDGQGGFWTDEEAAAHFQAMRDECDLTDDDIGPVALRGGGDDGPRAARDCD